MKDAGPGRLLVVEFCCWLCLVTWFVHVVARRRSCRRQRRVVGACGGMAVLPRNTWGIQTNPRIRLGSNVPSGSPCY